MDLEYDEELRWRLEVLKAQFEDGNIKIAPNLADDFERSLMAVKYLPDGRIDLASVDGRVRSMAMLAAFSHSRKMEKDAAPQYDIAQMYFQYIEANLGSFVQEAREKGYDAHDFATVVSRQPLAVADIAPQIPKFIEDLEEFWGKVTDASHYHIQDIQGTKAVFGGDLFPSYQRNIASSASLYIDTIVLTDPFLHSKEVFERSTPEMQVYYLIKHAINVLQYRELALAEFDHPIVVVTPYRSSVDMDEIDFLTRASEPDALAHVGAIFGRKFESLEELYEFTSNMETPEEVIEQAVDPERLLFDLDWNGSHLENLKRSLDMGGAEFLGEKHAGNLIVGHSIGRMMQATDILMKSRYLLGTPLIDAPTSWKYFNWKLEYSAATLEADSTHLHMVRGLQRAADTDMEWLGKIPPEALIEMRKEGAFEEIRSMLSSGISDIAHTKPDSFFRSSDHIVQNLQDSFHKHQQNINDLRAKKLKFAGYELGSWIVSGAIEVAAIATGIPTFGAAAFAVNQVVDAPKLKEIPERFRNLRDAHTELQKSPMGLLFAHK